jgi:hypothetical protein
LVYANARGKAMKGPGIAIALPNLAQTAQYGEWPASEKIPKIPLQPPP